MKKLQAMGAAVCAALFLGSCGSGKTALKPEALNGDWNITTVNGRPATAEKQPFIGLDIQEKRLYGCAGCNRIMGSFEASWVLSRRKNRGSCRSGK